MNFPFEIQQHSLTYGTNLGALVRTANFAQDPESDDALDFVGGMLSTKNIPMIGIQDHKEHLLRRRPWNRAMSVSALKEYESILATRCEQLVHCIEEQRGKVFINKWFNCFVYDFVCDIA